MREQMLMHRATVLKEGSLQGSAIIFVDNFGGNHKPICLVK